MVDCFKQIKFVWVPLNREAPLHCPVISSNLPSTGIKTHLMLASPASKAHMHVNCFETQLLFSTTAAFLLKIFIHSRSERNQKLMLGRGCSRALLVGLQGKMQALFPSHSAQRNILHWMRRGAGCLIPAYWWPLFVGGEALVTGVICINVGPRHQSSRNCHNRNPECFLFKICLQNV